MLKFENPFESRQIKNYLLFYAGIVVIMILFFIASSLFNDIKQEKRKMFDTTPKKSVLSKEKNSTKEKTETPVVLMKQNVY
jgi:hypothetical protein